MDFNEFIREQLYPVLTREYLSAAFPTFEFSKHSNYWTSPFYLNGERSHRKDKTFVYVGGQSVTENGGETLSLINFARRISGCTVMEAIQHLADVCHLTLPLTEKDTAQYAEQKHKKSILTVAIKTAQETLFSSQGTHILEYLHGRGYTDTLIKSMGLGALSPLVHGLLNQAGYIIPVAYCTQFPLMIIYKSFDTVLGFKFRCITPVSEGGKYRNTSNLNNLINTHPYLFSNNDKNTSLYVVEGELDALHAYALGITNICAVSGTKNGLPLSTLQVFVSNGYKRLIFVPDNDTAGVNFVINTLKNSKTVPCEFFVKSLPRDVKDLDEYLQVAGVGGFSCRPVVAGTSWWAGVYEEQYYALHGNDISNNAALVDEFISGVLDIARYGNALAEENIKIGLADACGCSKSSLDAYAARYNEFKNESERLENTKAFSQTLQELIGQKTTKDLSVVTKSFIESDARLCPNAKYQRLKGALNAAQISALFSTTKAVHNTKFVFSTYCSGAAAPSMRLQIPNSALTVVAAPTSHGKSTFLRNLALDVLDEDKCVVYFTLEESLKDVITQFINTYLFGFPEFQTYPKSLFEPIKQHLGGQEMTAFCGPWDTREILKARINEFLVKYVYTGKLRIIDENLPASELLASLVYLAQNVQIGAVFIDYIQIINYDSTKLKTDAIKTMCLSLKDYAIKYDIPVVLAAQLNRDVKTPFRLDNINLAECADIERAANTIICLWNSQFKSAVYGLKAIGKEEQNELDRLEADGFSMGTPGQIFIKITKQRADRGVGMYTIYKYEGAKGLITAP